MRFHFVSFTFLFLLLTNEGLYSQTHCSFVFDEKESLEHFPDGIYKDEIMLFAHHTDSPNLTLQQMFFFEDNVVWSLADGVAKLSVRHGAFCYKPLTIEIDGSADSTYIKGIDFTYIKKYCHFPDSAIRDIVNPIFLGHFIRNPQLIEEYYQQHDIVKRYRDRGKPQPIIENWKVYSPKQIQLTRFYLYMIDYRYKYEVIWIVDQDKYIGRVVNKLE